MPRIFILIIGMAYRYLFLLLGTVTDMFQARQARTPGTPKHDASARAFVGAGVGTLLGKAAHLSEEVHQAMVARGFRGDATTLDRPHPRRVDLLCAALVVVVSVVLLWGDQVVVPR